MVGVYNAALAPLRLAAAVWALRHARGPRAAEWRERLARQVPRISRPGGVWIHGASLGEARIVGALARALRRRTPDLPLAVSAVSPAGRAQLPAAPDVDAAFFLPLDFAGLPTRVLRAVAPGVLTLVETELWPNLLREAHAMRVPVVLANARLSPARMRWYRRLSALYAPLLRDVARVGARSTADAERLGELGVPAHAISVTGNVKYDLPPPAGDRPHARRELGIAADRPVWVCGSTRPGEEQVLVDAWLALRREMPGLVLVLAPRHAERFDEVERLIEKAGFDPVRWSHRSPERATPPEILLVDRLGVLGRAYLAADVAFVGGTLAQIGGHNVLEPAAAGVPVLFGPHTSNVEDEAADLLAAHGARRVLGAEDLAREVAELLREPARARAMGQAARGVVEAHRGALERTIDIVLEARTSGRA
jgi:3-deoxy-D-manno-octulosonic-acid transferase